MDGIILVFKVRNFGVVERIGLELGIWNWGFKFVVSLYEVWVLDYFMDFSVFDY